MLYEAGMRSNEPNHVSDDRAQHREASPRELLIWAIDHELCVRARHRQSYLILGPHIVYERGGTLFVDAAIIERDGHAVSANDIVRFKVAGLRNIIGTMEAVPLAEGFTIDRYTDAERIHAVIGESIGRDQALPLTAS